MHPTDDLFIRIGTLSHNTTFSATDFQAYTGYPAAKLQSLKRAGMIATAERGRYYPTAKGWTAIESAYAAAKGNK